MVAKLNRDEVVELQQRVGRKRSDQLAAMPRPQGRNVVWAAIRGFDKLGTNGRGGGFTVGQLETATRVPQDTIRSYLQGLLKAGYVGKDRPPQKKNGRGVPAFQAAVFTLLRDVGVDAPRVTRKGEEVTQGRANETMWQAMRIMKDFTDRELVATASSRSLRISLDTANTYLKFLRRAGYLQVIAEGKPGRPARYALDRAMNTGPLPPQIQSIKQVFDQNKNRVMPFLDAEVDA